MSVRRLYTKRCIFDGSHVLFYDDIACIENFPTRKALHCTSCSQTHQVAKRRDVDKQHASSLDVWSLFFIFYNQLTRLRIGGGLRSATEIMVSLSSPTSFSIDMVDRKSNDKRSYYSFIKRGTRRRGVTRRNGDDDTMHRWTRARE